MALRIRKNRKTIICAAESKPLEGDYYIDDTLHHILVGDMKVLVPAKGNKWVFCHRGNQ